MALLLGCGGSVELKSTTGGGGDGGGGEGGGGGGATLTVTGTGPGTTTSESVTSTSTPEEDCPGLPADAFRVDMKVGGASYHLAYDCPYYGMGDGPAAYAWTNGKSGPEWYFTIAACEVSIPEGSSAGPSIHIQASIPEGAAVTAPYATVGDIVHVTDDQNQLDPATSPKILFETFSLPHGLVTGTFAGTVVLPSGEAATIEGEFSVCRRDDLIFI